MNTLENLTLYGGKCGLKGFIIFFLFWLEIRDCGYMFEPHRQGTIDVLSKSEKNITDYHMEMTFLEKLKLTLYCRGMLS